MPASFGKLLKVTKISLGPNQLSGALPDELGQMKALKEIVLDGLPEVEIPPALAQCKKLKNISMKMKGDMQPPAIPPEVQAVLEQNGAAPAVRAPTPAAKAPATEDALVEQPAPATEALATEDEVVVDQPAPVAEAPATEGELVEQTAA